MDNFVFFSHASKDKPLLRPMVQALIDAGIKVWLDQPSALGYCQADIERHFYRIRAGGRWSDEIDEAKRRAGCIVVCWSKRAAGPRALMRHPVWFAEADYGRTEKKLVSCRIDDVAPSLIPAGHGEQQVPDMRSETERALIIEDVKRVMRDYAGTMSGHRGASDKRRSPRTPYLADRTSQEEAIEQALHAVNRDGGVRPFFIVGPENECIDEFVKRLEEDTSRRCLGGEHGWETIEVEWPTDEPGARFGQSFARRIAARLGHGAQLSATDLASAFSARRRPVAVVSRLLAMDWKGDEADRVRAWLTLWRAIGEAAGHRAVLPVLRIKMPAAKPGWSDVPKGGWFDGAGRRNSQIWKMLAKLSAEFEDLSVGRPPILGPLPETDIDIWRDKHFSLDDKDRARALASIARLLGNRDHKRGVPHADFAAEMLPLFRGSV